MDGVLADTAAWHYAAWVLILSRRGVAFPKERFQELFGVSNVATLTALLGAGTDPRLIREISDEKEMVFRNQIHGRVRTFPGVRTWLGRLKAGGARMAIASSGPPQNIAAILSELHFQEYFEAVISGGEGLPPKPDPAMFRSAAAAIGLAPSCCLVIEDSPAGVEAARRAGMKCIAVTSTHPAGDLGAASLVVRRLDELPTRSFEQLFFSHPPGKDPRPVR